MIQHYEIPLPPFSLRPNYFVVFNCTYCYWPHFSNRIFSGSNSCTNKQHTHTNQVHTKFIVDCVAICEIETHLQSLYTAHTLSATTDSPNFKIHEHFQCSCECECHCYVYKLQSEACQWQALCECDSFFSSKKWTNCTFFCRSMCRR